ncbi:MAG: GIY-YIG nuclease family protein [Colwellia sp.]
MSQYGRSIKIFLSDGSPIGLRHVEIANWSGQALACPRSRFSELGDWEESQRPGVYFLFEKASADENNLAYIGESENVFRRLADHDRKKEFWNEVIIFTSKDENLTKGHIKYLEARLAEITKGADRYQLQNSVTPTKSNLPRSDSAAMEEFIDNIRIILGSLGHRILEATSSEAKVAVIPDNKKSLLDYELFFDIHKLKARGKVTDDGFLLLKGSQISHPTSSGLHKRIIDIKNHAINSGELEDSKDHYVLLKDKVFSSSSYAASYVTGNNRSGPKSWKTKIGDTLKTLEENLLNKN